MERPGRLLPSPARRHEQFLSLRWWRWELRSIPGGGPSENALSRNPRIAPLRKIEELLPARSAQRAQSSEQVLPIGSPRPVSFDRLFRPSLDSNLSQSQPGRLCHKTLYVATCPNRHDPGHSSRRQPQRSAQRDHAARDRSVDQPAAGGGGAGGKNKAQAVSRQQSAFSPEARRIARWFV